MLNDKNSSLSDLNSQIYEVVRAAFGESSSAKKASEIPSRITPNAEGELPEKVVFLCRKYIALHGYLILLHYTEDELLRWYLRLDLEDFLRTNFQFYWMSVLTEDRQLYLKYLQDQQWISARGFFGNICCKNNLVTCWRSIVIRFEKRIKPKRLQRHRGYRDKGTLPSLDERVRREEAKNDAWLREEQLEQEERLLQQEEDIRLFRNYLRGNGSLLESHKFKFRLTKKGEQGNEKAVRRENQEE